LIGAFLTKSHYLKLGVDEVDELDQFYFEL